VIVKVIVQSSIADVMVLVTVEYKMKPEDIPVFYEDMRNPKLTIHDVLVKYNTNLKEALSIIRGYHTYQTQKKIKRIKQCKKDTQ